MRFRLLKLLLLLLSLLLVSLPMLHDLRLLLHLLLRSRSLRLRLLLRLARRLLRACGLLLRRGLGLLPALLEVLLRYRIPRLVTVVLRLEDGLLRRLRIAVAGVFPLVGR